MRLSPNICKFTRVHIQIQIYHVQEPTVILIQHIITEREVMRGNRQHSHLDLTKMQKLYGYWVII